MHKRRSGSSNTIDLATFRGRTLLKAANDDVQDELGARRASENDPLVLAGENAHNLTVALRAKGWEAYEFHDRHESYVSIGSFDDVHLLSVALDRLTRWHRPGLLAIGDAAHAMSPIGGIGINLAVQDAVAAANLLADPLLRERGREVELAHRVVGGQVLDESDMPLQQPQ